MSDDKGLTAGGGRRHRPSLALASPLENEDTLSEILLRLPPLPSSLPRASLVCKLWRRLISGPGFIRRFRARHRHNPPLLGFFSEDSKGHTSCSFTPTLEPPDRVPSDCFSLPPMGDYGEIFIPKCREDFVLSCRHGLVLELHRGCAQVTVWDPVTGDVSYIPIPEQFDTSCVVGAVLRIATDVNQDGYSSHFQVVLLEIEDKQTFVCVYSSETGVWDNPISITVCPSRAALPDSASTLIGRSLYWWFPSNDILEFDLDRQSLVVIDLKFLSSLVRRQSIWVMAVDGVLGFLFKSVNHIVELWKRIADSDGVAMWVLERTFKLFELLPQQAHDDPCAFVEIVAIAEDNDVFFLQTKIGIFKIHLESMQCKKVSELRYVDSCHSFSSVYTAGLGIDAREDAGEPLH